MNLHYPATPTSQRLPQTYFELLHSSNREKSKYTVVVHLSEKTFQRMKFSNISRIPGSWHNDLQIEFIPGTPTYFLSKSSYIKIRVSNNTTSKTSLLYACDPVAMC